MERIKSTDLNNIPPKIILDVHDRDDFFSLDKLNSQVPSFESDTDSYELPKIKTRKINNDGYKDKQKKFRRTYLKNTNKNMFLPWEVHQMEFDDNLKDQRVDEYLLMGNK